ncbi:MAG: DNA repair protein [Pseudomonadota bacterium]
MSETGAGQSWLQMQQFGQKIAFTAVIGCAIALGAASASALLGFAPWVTINASYGTVPISNAGMIAQISLTVFALGLCFYLPANRRIMSLEATHRNFQITMEDVARAYAIAHQADRETVFSLSSEFDAVRERISFMRAHPDLDTLEPAVLELAAQMSQEARELADVYSDEKVTRARLFLKQRQQEIEAYRDQLSLAQQTVKDLKRWSQQVQVEDSVVRAQLARLEEDLAEILPLLGYEMSTEMVAEPENVVSIATPPEQGEIRLG